MRRLLKMLDGSTIGIDAFDTLCEGCRYFDIDNTGVGVCTLWQRRDTWGDRLRECIDAEAEAEAEAKRRLALREEPL